MSGWRPMPRPAGVLAVHHIEEGSVPMLRFDRKNPPDLDELMMWLATVDEYGDPDGDSRFFDVMTEQGWGDSPTKVRGVPFRDPEVKPGWLRMSPCWCGDGHAWHVDYGLRSGDDPTGEPRRRGVFLGLWSAW